MRKNYNLSLRLSKTEHDRLLQLATSRKIRTSELMRELVNNCFDNEKVLLQGNGFVIKICFASALINKFEEIEELSNE